MHRSKGIKPLSTITENSQIFDRHAGAKSPTVKSPRISQKKIVVDLIDESNTEIKLTQSNTDTSSPLRNLPQWKDNKRITKRKREGYNLETKIQSILSKTEEKLPDSPNDKWISTKHQQRTKSKKQQSIKNWCVHNESNFDESTQEVAVQDEIDADFESESRKILSKSTEKLEKPKKQTNTQSDEDLVINLRKKRNKRMKIKNL